MKIFLCCCLGPHDSIPPIHCIEVDLKYPPFTPKQLHKKRTIGLEGLPQKASFGPEKNRPGRLHGNGACPPGPPSKKDILEGLIHFYKVEPVMGQKPLVFTGQDCPSEIW